MPNMYRGPYHDDDADAGAKYAKSVDYQIKLLKAKGRRLACFISESIIGCGGQVVLPKNYLREV